MGHIGSWNEEWMLMKRHMEWEAGTSSGSYPGVSHAATSALYNCHEFVQLNSQMLLKLKHANMNRRLMVHLLNILFELWGKCLTCKENQPWLIHRNKRSSNRLRKFFRFLLLINFNGFFLLRFPRLLVHKNGFTKNMLRPAWWCF